MKKQIREEIYNKFNGKCAYCGCDLENIKNMQVDHIIPQRNFMMHILNKDFWVPNFLKHLNINDVNHKDNLNPSCRVCNKWKTAFSLEDFRRELSLQLERLNKNSSNFRIAKKYGLIEEKYKNIKFYFEKLKS